MTIEFHCVDDGRRLYAVREFGSQLFVGTRGECDRFLEIHLQKVVDQRIEDNRIRRHRPFMARRYRVSRMHA